MKGIAEGLDKQSAEKKGDAKPSGIAQEQDNSLERRALLGGQHQGGAEKCSNAGGPAYCKDHAKKQGRTKAHILGVPEAAAAAEQGQLENS